MDVFSKMIIGLQGEDCMYELPPFDIDDYDDRIEVYSSMRHPDLTRGFVGDLIYRVGGYSVEDGKRINTNINGYKDVLLQKIQCWHANAGDVIEWKYTFLKN